MHKRTDRHRTMSQGAFAKKHGVRRRTVCTWRAKGYVLLAPNGEVDVPRASGYCARDQNLTEAAFAEGRAHRAYR